MKFDGAQSDFNYYNKEYKRISQLREDILTMRVKLDGATMEELNTFVHEHNL